MLKHRIFWIWVTTAAGLAGCGNNADLCDRYDLVKLGLIDRARACNNVSFTILSKATCEQSLKSCNSNDQQILSSTLDCLEHSVGVCIAGQDNVFTGSIALCEQALGPMSSACKNAGFGPH